jgi:hypothetical protein
MSYLEELLPEFRKGAKIRRSNWPEGHCVKLDTNKEFTVDNNNKIYTIYAEELLADNWEFYQESIDFDYIIKNKCLCWFWDDINPNIKEIEFLENIFDDEDGKYYASNGTPYENCHPVRRDEVTFYEDNKDE